MFINVFCSFDQKKKKPELEVSSLGGPDYATTNGVRREQDGHHLIYIKGRFYRPVEPGDLKNKWE